MTWERFKKKYLQDETLKNSKTSVLVFLKKKKNFTTYIYVHLNVIRLPNYGKYIICSNILFLILFLTCKSKSTVNTPPRNGHPKKGQRWRLGDFPRRNGEEPIRDELGINFTCY